MSSAGPTNSLNPESALSTSSKSKKNKKKKNAKAKTNGTLSNEDVVQANETESRNADEEEQDTSPISEPQSPFPGDDNRSGALNSKKVLNDGQTMDASEKVPTKESNGVQQQVSRTGGNSDTLRPSDPSEAQNVPGMSDMKLGALLKEREALRDEVARMRKNLEEMQERHEEELGNIREQLSQTEEEKESAETQYQNLLGKVNTIRSQLGERLKADAEDLKEARSKIGNLEEENQTLRVQSEARAAELSTIADDNEHRSKELSSLRNRMTLSQQNWAKERDDLLQREALAKEDFEAARQAMSDWEVLAIEERSIRENIVEKVSELEEQAASHREVHERLVSERDSQSATIDGLQRALQEIQDARRKELREIVENSQVHVEDLQKQLRDAEAKATESSTALESTEKELERALPFEKEVNEKNLLIGKLRHEAVILNDHLTKALRYLKKGKPQDTIDKQLITNHFIHFLALDRTDPKKFQVLQIIASLLEWSDEQREQSGLARPGASNPTSKIPVSPWHRTPSTPQLSSEFFPSSGARKESLAELWSGFLEQEAQEKPPGVQSPPSSSGGSRPP